MEETRAIYRNINTYDVLQGDLGDCWLVSSITALSNQKHLLKKIFVTSNSITQSRCLNHGCHGLNLCMNGKWETIIIDDMIPCRPDGRVKYAQTYENQMWGSLIEKAIAKYNKTYENLASGKFNEGTSHNFNNRITKCGGIF